MRKNILLTLSLLLLAFVFASCANANPAVADSNPMASETLPAPKPQPSPLLSEMHMSSLRNLMNQIEEARKLAVDFESPAYFPSDWETVESDYAVGNLVVRIINASGTAADETELSKISERDIQEGNDWLNKILNAYKELSRKSIPLYAQAREDEIMSIRDELIGTGLTEYFPEYLFSADKKAIKALEQYEAEDYYAARDTAVLAMDEYETLLLGANIILTRDELISTGLTFLYPEYLQSADNKAFAALDLYDADDYRAALEAGAPVLSEYQAMLLGAMVVFKIEELVDTGLTRQYPEYLTYADSLAYDAVDQFEAEDYDGSIETGIKAYNAYNDLLAAAVVYLRREEILNRGFYVYDMENFDNADEIALDAIDLYEAGNKIAAEEKAEEAMLRYNVLLTNGWISYSLDRRTFTTAVRERAVTGRVNIAMRDAFREADALFNLAEDYFKAERYDEAAGLFTDSEALFIIAIEDTAERRRRAEAAIRAAEEEIQGSMGAAIEAERIIEGGSR